MACKLNENVKLFIDRVFLYNDTSRIILLMNQLVQKKIILHRLY